MSEENNISEFNEKFATIEDALKYIADSQAKSEWLRKQDQIESKKRMAEGEKRMAEGEKRMAESEKRMAEAEKHLVKVEKHLAHITKVLRFNIEEYEFQEDKLQEAGEILRRKKS